MRPYVEKAEATIKEGVNVALGRKTLVVGPNAHGKTTLVQTLELALTGSASDIAGRLALAKDSDLFDFLAPPDAPEIKAGVRFDTGATCVWSLERGRRARHVTPAGLFLDAVFPLRAVREAILGNAETARKFVLEQVEMSWPDILAFIPESLRDDVQRLVPGARVGDAPDVSNIGLDAAGALVLALETARRRVREAKSEAKAQRDAITTASQGLGPPPTEAEIEASRSKATAAPTNELLAELLEARAAAETAAKALRQLDDEVRELGTPPAQHPAVPAAITVMEATVGRDACYLCGHAVDPRMMRARLETARGKLAADLQLSARLQDLGAKRREAGLEQGQATRNVERLEREKARLAQIGASAAPDPALVARRARWESIRKQEEAALAAERDAARYAQLAEACATAMQRVLDGARESFEAQVQKWLPTTDRFGMVLDTAFRVGLRGAPPGARNAYPPDFLRAALSGAEWARVTAAIAMACAPSDPDVPVVILPEERAFDLKTLEAVLEAFSAVDAQVILTTPTAPKNVPDDWTVVDMREANKARPRRKGGKLIDVSEPEPESALDHLAQLDKDLGL